MGGVVKMGTGHTTNYGMQWGFTLATLVVVVPLASLAEALAPLVDLTVAARGQWRRGTPWLFVCCAMLCGQRSTIAVSRWVSSYGPGLARVLERESPVPFTDASLLTAIKGLDRDRFEALLRAWATRQGIDPDEIAAVPDVMLRDARGAILPGIRPLAAYAHHHRAAGPAPMSPEEITQIGDARIPAPLASLGVAIAEALPPGGKRAHERGVALLTLAVCAMMDGARSYYAISRWARQHAPLLLAPLGLRSSPNLTHYTFWRLFTRIDTTEFERSLERWVLRQGVTSRDITEAATQRLVNMHGELLPGVTVASTYARLLTIPRDDYQGESVTPPVDADVGVRPA
jgi:hypothetical protein